MADQDLKEISSLVDRVRAGDSGAKASVFALTYEEQYRRTRRTVEDREKVWSILEKTYLLAFRNLSTLHDSDAFVRWLSSINDRFSGAKTPGPAPSFSSERPDHLRAGILMKTIQQDPESSPETASKVPGDSRQRFRIRNLPGSLRAFCHRLPDTLRDFFARTLPAFFRKLRLAEILALGLALLCILLLLFFLPVPKYTVREYTDRGSMPVYIVTLRNRFLSPKVVADINGIPLPAVATEDGKNTYTVSPDQEGTLSLSVTYRNGRSRFLSLPVKKTDNVSPYLMEDRSSLEYGTLTLCVADKDTAVDYDKVYALDPLLGTEISPASVDRDTGIILFENCPDELKVYVPDTAGNVLQILIDSEF